MKINSVKFNTISSTGAEDTFTAGLVYSHLNKFDIDYSAKFAMAASTISLSHDSTINPTMFIDNVNKILKEMILC